MEDPRLYRSRRGPGLVLTRADGVAVELEAAGVDVRELERVRPTPLEEIGRDGLHPTPPSLAPAVPAAPPETSSHVRLPNESSAACASGALHATSAIKEAHAAAA